MDDRQSDAELMERVRDEHDPDAFARLVARWRPRLAGYFGPLLDNAAAVDDAVQDVLIGLWSRRSEYLARGRFSAFMLRLAEHHWLNLRRRLALRQTEALDEAAEPAAADTALEAVRREMSHRLAHAAAALPPPQREVLRLVHEEDLAQNLVAERLAVPLGTVKSRLHAARRRLRAVLEEMDDV